MLRARTIPWLIGYFCERRERLLHRPYRIWWRSDAAHMRRIAFRFGSEHVVSLIDAFFTSQHESITSSRYSIATLAISCDMLVAALRRYPVNGGAS